MFDDFNIDTDFGIEDNLGKTSYSGDYFEVKASVKTAMKGKNKKEAMKKTEKALKKLLRKDPDIDSNKVKINVR